MSKKKPEKVWMFCGSIFPKYCDKTPKVGALDDCGGWSRMDGNGSDRLGWDSEWNMYTDEDKAKVTLFMKGFLACQAMYAEMFKEADDAD